ncbi:MAG: hypothetical protein ACM3KE_15395 [Hyphomicrobiales bacterium]
MRLEESLDRLEIRVDHLLKKATAYDGAFAKGFEKGMVFALLMVQGINVFDPADPELTALRKSPARTTGRGQLTLF